MRTDYCGNIDSSYIGQEVTLCGWVNKRRDLGGVIFIDLRDREGIVQVVFDPDLPDVLAVANTLRSEFCVKLTGKVRARPEGPTANLLIDDIICMPKKKRLVAGRSAHLCKNGYAAFRRI